MSFNRENLLGRTPETSLERAAIKIDDRAIAMGALDGEIGVQVPDMALMYIGMPVSADDAQDFVRAVCEVVIAAIAKGDAEPIQAIRAGVENALLVGIMVDSDD